MFDLFRSFEQTVLFRTSVTIETPITRKIQNRSHWKLGWWFRVINPIISIPQIEFLKKKVFKVKCVPIRKSKVKVKGQGRMTHMIGLSIRNNINLVSSLYDYPFLSYCQKCDFHVFGDLDLDLWPKITKFCDLTKILEIHKLMKFEDDEIKTEGCIVNQSLKNC